LTRVQKINNLELEKKLTYQKYFYQILMINFENKICKLNELKPQIVNLEIEYNGKCEKLETDNKRKEKENQFLNDSYLKNVDKIEDQSKQVHL